MMCWLVEEFFSRESSLGDVLAWRVVSVPVSKRDHGADSELVQRKAAQNFVFHFSSISLQLLFYRKYR